MSVPVPPCIRCKTVPIVRTVQPKAARARVVVVELCQCDWPKCPNVGCRKPVPMFADRCPACGAT